MSGTADGSILNDRNGRSLVEVRAQGRTDHPEEAAQDAVGVQPGHRVDQLPGGGERVVLGLGSCGSAGSKRAVNRPSSARATAGWASSVSAM